VTTIPYIKKEERPALDEHINRFHAGLSAGELAYIVYRLLLRATLGGSFVTYATMIGAVGLTLFRFIVKVVMPYEDDKQCQNGDVTE
jgi:hypothetical protein